MVTGYLYTFYEQSAQRSSSNFKPKAKSRMPRYLLYMKTLLFLNIIHGLSSGEK